MAAFALAAATIYVVTRTASAAAISEWRVMTRVGWAVLGFVGGLLSVVLATSLLRRSSSAAILSSWASLTVAAFILEVSAYDDMATPIRGVGVLSAVGLVLALMAAKRANRIPPRPRPL